MTQAIYDFVSLPGFFRLEKGSRAVSVDESVVNWSAGADPFPGGSPMGAVIWGHGSTAAEAIDKCIEKMGLATEKAMRGDAAPWRV